MSALQSATAVATLKSGFLDGIAASDLRTILAAARQRHFLAHSVIVNQGEPADHLYLLTSGRARFFYNTQDGRKAILSWLIPGDIFGGAAIVSTLCPYLVSTEALQDCHTFVWDRHTLRNLVMRYPKLWENGFLIAYDYFAWYVADHVALISHTARQRLANVIVCLSETIGKKVAAGYEFDATNEELAGAANVTPFTVSRLLNEWQREHAIVKSRGKITIVSRERLLDCAG